MNAQHTPGPWGVIIGDAGPIVFSGNKGNMVAQCVKGFSTIERDANARLISAAPDLLEALELAHAMLCGANMNEKVVAKKVIAAIAKATGA